MPISSIAITNVATDNIITAPEITPPEVVPVGGTVSTNNGGLSGTFERPIGISVSFDNGATWTRVGSGTATFPPTGNGNLTVNWTGTLNQNLSVFADKEGVPALFRAVVNSSNTGGGASTATSPSFATTVDTVPEPICFYAGTLVATPSGDLAVESLKAGDLVLTADGRAVPVRWMGRQTISTRFADPMSALPVRIRAGALGEGLPRRDLLISPGHALLVAGVLAQAGAMVNGTTITRERDVPEVFTYWHVEVADHALILAEGAPAETFVDNADRANFDNWAEYQALVGDEAPIAEMALPRARAARQLPPAARDLIAARAEVLLGTVSAAA